jgi:hypothetical protein
MSVSGKVTGHRAPRVDDRTFSDIGGHPRDISRDIEEEVKDEPHFGPASGRFVTAKCRRGDPAQLLLLKIE